MTEYPTIDTVMLHIKTMSKKLALLILLVIFLAGSIWWYVNNFVIPQPEQVVNTITNSQDKSQSNQQESSFSPKHITAIPGSNQVWYEIPEMGIKLLLSKEAAEELVYKYRPKKDVNIFVEMHGVESDLKIAKDIESVTFFWEKVVAFRNGCDSFDEKCVVKNSEDVEFYVSKVPGIYHEESLAFGARFIKQFSDFYLIGDRRRESYGVISEEKSKYLEEVIIPYLPKTPSLQEIRVDLLEAE